MWDIFTQFLQQLLQTGWLEWIATLSGFLCVYLAARQNLWNWPVSIVSVCTYMYIFYVHRLYGDAVLQLYFLTTAIYGWYYWRKGYTEKPRPIHSLSRMGIAGSILMMLMLTAVLSAVLHRWTDTDVPYADGFCTSMSFVAQLLMTRKILQNWLFWVIVDICYIPLYLHKDLAMTAVLYLIFAIIAWKGYKDWKRTFLNTKQCTTNTPPLQNLPS